MESGQYNLGINREVLESNMSDLTSQLISNTYKQIILVSSSTSNTGVDTSLKAVQTGDGVNTALKVATNAVQITGALGVDGCCIFRWTVFM